MGPPGASLPARAAGALHLYPVRLARRKGGALALRDGLRYRDRVAVRGASIPRGRVLEFVLHLPNFVRLYWRLFRDPRVSIWPKAMLVAALAYVVLPFDLIPDAIPGVGEIDDLVIVLAAARWFIAWCPGDVVREHARAIDGRGRG